MASKNRKTVCEIDFLPQIEKVLEDLDKARRKMKKSVKRAKALQVKIAAARPCEVEEKNKPKPDGKKKKSKKKEAKQDKTGKTGKTGKAGKAGKKDRRKDWPDQSSSGFFTTPLLKIVGEEEPVTDFALVEGVEPTSETLGDGTPGGEAGLLIGDHEIEGAFVEHFEDEASAGELSSIEVPPGEVPVSDVPPGGMPASEGIVPEEAGSDGGLPSGTVSEELGDEASLSGVPFGLLNVIDEPAGSGSDDLKLINGIGPKLEEVLNGLGVYQFSQIAAWGQPEIKWVEEYLQFPGRIERDNWIEQAKALAKGGRDEYVRVFGKEPR